MKEKIKFYGIDSWNRPIFKSLDRKNYYGSVDRLCSTKEEIEKITEFDLCFFGNSFDCEPMGTPATNIEIVKEVLKWKNAYLNIVKSVYYWINIISLVINI